MGVSVISGSLIGGKIYQLAGGESMYFFWSLISAGAGIIYSLYLVKKKGN
jgi:PPP family 3-phenylpropionic acid transporter